MKAKIFSIRGYRAVRFVYAFIFIYAGINKLMDPKSFAVVIEAFGLIPESWITPISVLLPALELLAGLGLLFDIQGSLNLITGLLILFTAIVGYGIWLGLDIDCGCFGPEDPEGQAYASLRPTLYRNLILIICVLYLYLWRYYQAAQPVQVFSILKK